MEDRGFVVPKHSRSNNTKTILSISSTLNMDYLQIFVPNLESSDLWWLMFPWLDHNQVRTPLERIGYTSVSTSTDWSITDNPTTDYYLKSHPIILSDLERYFLGVTPAKTLQPLFEKFSSAPTYEAHRRSQLNNFKVLGNLNATPGPMFVFTHSLPYMKKGL